MNRKNLLLAAGSCLLFMAACQSPKDQIVRKWQVENIEDPFSDSMLKVQEKSLDTMTVLDSNLAMYAGTSNLDSFKTWAKKQMHSQMDERNKMAKQVSMNFLKDGILIQENNGRADTLKYTLTEDKRLLLSLKTPPPGMPSRTDTMKVEKISSSDLRLKIEQGPQKLFINLKPAADKKAEDKK